MPKSKKNKPRASAKAQKPVGAQRARALGRRLAKAWITNNDTDELFNEALTHPVPAEVFIAAAEHLDEEDRIDFSTDMFDTAGDFDTKIFTPDGGAFDVSLRLFTVVLQGPEWQIAQLCAGPAFDEILDLVKSTGLANPDPGYQHDSLA